VDGVKLAASGAVKSRENPRWRPEKRALAAAWTSGTRFAQGYSGQTMWSKTKNEMSRGQEIEKEE
jgi:tryptophan-rich sensory protein